VEEEMKITIIIVAAIAVWIVLSYIFAYLILPQDASDDQVVDMAAGCFLMLIFLPMLALRKAHIWVEKWLPFLSGADEFP
jgi:hypothetical protein